MINLNKLTLHLNISRSKLIDGIHFNEEFLPHMLHLNTFIFHICTITPPSETIHDDIQNTINNWNYSPVNCSIDHFSDEYKTYSHIYSIPYQMNRFMYLTNSIRGDYFPYVIDVTLYDIRSFEHDFFQWLSQAFPLLKYLKIENLTPQKNKDQISSKIFYLNLYRLRLTDVHIDYANQFLCDTNAYVPCLHTLVIPYDELAYITNDFTNDTTRFICGQLKKIEFHETFFYPEQFYLYFPFLKK
jgi:hypothetical protein